MNNILELALIISGASLGFRAITDKGMIFYFLREWLDNLTERRKYYLDWIDFIEKEIDDIEALKKDELNGLVKQKKLVQAYWPNKYNSVLYLFKPIILCSTCMASVHTLIWIPILSEYNRYTVAIMLIVAILNTIIWSLVELIKKKHQ